ncbi:MAG: hypothetical protein ACUVWB_12885 [Anaerolineae bacterium]
MTRHLTRRQMLLACTAFILALITLGGLPPLALAQAPAGEPRIAFAARIEQNWDI